jgi:hypothetical protein
MFSDDRKIDEAVERLIYSMDPNPYDSRHSVKHGDKNIADLLAAIAAKFGIDAAMGVRISVH